MYDPSGDAMQGARVSLVRPNGDVVAEAGSGRDGRFELSRVATGVYTIRITSGGFKSVETRVTVSETVTAFVPVLMPLTDLAGDAEQIGGIVLDHNGAPAANVSVCPHVPFAACDPDLAVSTDRAGKFSVWAPRHVPLVVVAVGDGRFGATMSPPVPLTASRPPITVVLSPVASTGQE